MPVMNFKCHRAKLAAWPGLKHILDGADGADGADRPSEWMQNTP
jgi:hypothetical protein